MASPWSLDGNGAERTEGDGSLWRGECTPRGRGPGAAYARRHAGLRRARRPLAFRAAVAGLLGA